MIVLVAALWLLVGLMVGVLVGKATRGNRR